MRGRRSGFEIFYQDQNLRLGTFDFEFDPAIIEIPNPAAEPSLRCDAKSKRPIPHSLDLSLHIQLGPESCRFNRFGHMLKQFARYKATSPTNGYSHTCAGASRDLRFRASKLHFTALKWKKEMLWRLFRRVK